MSAPNQVYKNVASSLDDPSVKNQYIDDRVLNLEYIISGGTGFVPIARTPSLVQYEDIEGAQQDTNLIPFTTYSQDDSLITAGLANPGATLNFPATTTLIDFHNTPVINFSAVGPGVSYAAIAPVVATDANAIIIDNTLSEISMQYADATYPGIVSTLAQPFQGAKTFLADIIPGANIALPLTSSATVGVINVNGSRFCHSYGTYNTFLGLNSGNFTMTGQYNSGFGESSLQTNTTGYSNAAFGYHSLRLNTTGALNAAIGSLTLVYNTTGSSNTALGEECLSLNISGNTNVAVGTGAMYNNLTGNDNVAMGVLSLFNSLGSSNTGIGRMSLNALTTGDANIALGYYAGSVLTTTSNNIDIGHVGVLADSGVIRIGTSGTHLKNFQQGIRGITSDTADALPVYISSTGQLTTVGSGGVYTVAAPVAASDANGIIIDSTLNTIGLEYATITQPGIVSTAAQSFLGLKTFSNVTLTALSSTGIVHNSAAGVLTTSLIVNADVHASAGIVDTKLATISTALKVSNSATTATASSTASAIVARDASQNFTTNSITLLANAVVNGNINMATTTSSTVGPMNRGGNRWLHDYGTDNIWVGTNAGNFTLTANQCQGIGLNTLINLASGAGNTAIGSYSLISLTAGSANIAIGMSASAGALTASQTVAIGAGALQANLVSDNTAIGYFAMNISTSGGSNTALGCQAGPNLTTGSSNIFIGKNSGQTLSTGSNNIYIGISATSSSDANVCKIGQIRGITTASATGLAVLIDTNGQLGTVSSIRSKKENIIEVDSDTNHTKLMALKPSRFDFIGCHGEYQTYGLIVDEVEPVAPELVAKDADNTPVSIYYDRIMTMLIAEAQRQSQHIAELYELNDALTQRLNNAGL